MEKEPTQAQIEYATDLFKKLGYDPDDYDFEKMTRNDVSMLIADLREEWEG